MTERGHSRKTVLAASSISTVIYAVVLNPFEVVKNTQIASYNHLSIPQTIRLIKAKSGFKGLWRGTVPAFLSTLISNLVYYSLYEELKPKADYYFQRLGPGLAAATSRAFSAAVASPVERLRTSVQGTGSGGFSLKTKGFQGLQATLYRDIIFSFSFFFLMENTYKVAKEYPLGRVLSTAFGGLVAVGVTQPFDVLKTKIQTNTYSFKKRNSFYGVKKILLEEGFRGTCRGLAARQTKLVLGLVLYINTYELLKQFLSSIN